MVAHLKEWSSSWLRHPLWLSVVLLSGCGWRLSATPLASYAEFRYCCKCLALATYACRATPELLPSNCSSLGCPAIYEDKDKDMEVVGDGDDEDEATTSSIACLALPLPMHDADSLMRRLSKLGLKIEATRQHNRHRFEIYETPALQKQARFTGGAQTAQCVSAASASSS